MKMFFKFLLQFITTIGLLSNLVFVYGKTDCDVLSSIYKSFQVESKITWKENTNKCCSTKGIECKDYRITKM